MLWGAGVPADDSDATRPTWSRAPRRASVEGRKNQVFGGFAGCGGRWVAQTAPKHVLEPPRSRCTALGGGRRSHAAPAAAARFCRFSRYGRSSRVPSHKIRCRGFPLTKKSGGSLYLVHLGHVTKGGPTHCSRNGLLGGLKMAKLRTYGG